MNSLKIKALVKRRYVQIKTIILMILLLPVSFLTSASDLQASMSVSPEQCVAMLQGQECYVSVQLTWQVESSGDYCLYTQGQNLPLNCWQNSYQGEFKKAFNSKVNLIFSLRRQHEKASLATAQVKMAWVHKKKGQARNSWRLF